MLRKIIPLLLLSILFSGSASRDWDGTTSVIASGYVSQMPAAYTITWYENMDTQGEASAGRMQQKASSVVNFANADGGSAGAANVFATHQWSTAQGQWISTVDAIVFDTWYHVAVAYDTGSTANDALIYIGNTLNGSSENNAPTGTVNLNTNEMFIGNNDATAVRTWNGSLLHVNIFDHILSAVEVSWNFFNPRIIPGSVYHLPLWESSGNEVDMQGGLTATATNMGSARVDSHPYRIGVHII